MSTSHAPRAKHGGRAEKRARSREAADSGNRETAEPAVGAAKPMRIKPEHAPALPRTVQLDAGERSRAAAFSAVRFDQLPLDSYLQRQIGERLQLSAMTPVQQRAIPALLSGRDLLVRSPTGSGKTLAYAVPAVQQLLALGPARVTRAAGTFVMVLVPTRELAVQSHEAIEGLCRPFPWLVTTMLMGGERRKAEKGRLRKGVALVVGTPGRVKDHVDSTAAFTLAQVIARDARRCCAPPH
jgi:ATP-dependent RNA helicase DDX31/DBP7